MLLAISALLRPTLVGGKVNIAPLRRTPYMLTCREYDQIRCDSRQGVCYHSYMSCTSTATCSGYGLLLGGLLLLRP